MFPWMLISCLALCAGSGGSRAATYYVDPESGYDSNPGTRRERPWASLHKVNEQVFQPGDVILLAAGSKFFGTLEPKGSGTAAAPIRLERYGEGSSPAIHGEGKALHTLLLHNVEYWEIRNLEITNRGKEVRAKRRGVIVRAQDFGDCRHIVLEGLEIHDVNGSLIKRDGGGSGILWVNGGHKLKTRFIDLQILNCHIHHCERNAINSTGNIRRDAWHPSRGVVIRGNLIEHVPGDGIVVVGAEGALVEYNVIRKGVDALPPGEAAAGIWPWSSDRTVIQFNEVSDHRAKWDGQGYDCDFNCFGTTIQYNYSHDNWGGFLLVCNNGETLGSPTNQGTRDSVVRYNLSLNDGLRPYAAHNRRFFSPVVHISGPVDNTRIDHNLIIMPPKPDADIENTLLEAGDWGGSFPMRIRFSENVVRNPLTPSVDWGDSTGVREEQNDLGHDFRFEERNPVKILAQFREHPLFRGQREFEVLYQFMGHRLHHPDPRLGLPKDD
jgi:hypothetical protein